MDPESFSGEGWGSLKKQAPKEQEPFNATNTPSALEAHGGYIYIYIY